MWKTTTGLERWRKGLQKSGSSRLRYGSIIMALRDRVYLVETQLAASANHLEGFVQPKTQGGSALFP